MNNQFEKFINIDYQKISTEILNLHSIEITTIAFFIAMIIALPLNSNQQNAMGNFFQLIGQAIETVSSTNTLRQSKQQPPSSSTDEEIRKLKQQIEALLKKKP